MPHYTSKYYYVMSIFVCSLIHSFNFDFFLSFSFSSQNMYFILCFAVPSPVYCILHCLRICVCAVCRCLFFFSPFIMLLRRSECGLYRTEEPLAANGNHLGFEIHQNSGYNRNNNNRNNGFYGAAAAATDVESTYSSNSNIETSDYFDDKYYEMRKHR